MELRKDTSQPPSDPPDAAGTAVAARRRRRRRWLVIAIGLPALLPALFAVLVTHSPAPPGTKLGIDVNHLRVIARRGGGVLPTAVGRWVVARSEAPRALVAASWDVVARTTFVFPAFQIAWADRYIVVDAPHERSTHDDAFGGAFDQAAYDGIARALLGAQQILVTHEHLDHVRGISQSPEFGQLAPRVRLTHAQIDGMPADAGFTAAQLAALRPLTLTEPTRVAPGVVLVPAPGHTPGSLYVFVSLANGQDVLLVGDTVWSHHSINLGVGRPLVVSLALREDRGAALGQLRALMNLRNRQPTVAIVPSHDDLTVQRYVDAGFLRDGFLTVQPTPPGEPTPMPVPPAP